MLRAAVEMLRAAYEMLRAAQKMPIREVTIKTLFKF